MHTTSGTLTAVRTTRAAVSTAAQDIFGTAGNPNNSRTPKLVGKDSNRDIINSRDASNSRDANSIVHWQQVGRPKR